MKQHRVTSLVVVGALLCVTCSCGPGGGFPSTPEGTVQHVAKELRENRPEVLWDALPASHQDDLIGLVHEFADKMDADLYNKVFTILRKLVNILDTKREIILESSLFERAPADRDAAAEKWDAVVDLLDTLVNCEISDLEKVRTIDLRQFALTTGRTLMDKASEVSTISQDDPFNAEFKHRLEKLEVERISAQGDTAMVRVTVPDQQPEEIELVRVDDRWLPKQLADEWPQRMAEARQQLAEIDSEAWAQGKAQAMMFLGMIEGALDKLATAETSEEFDQTVQGMFMGFLGGAAGGG
jgi:hypothetical protein